MLSLIFTFILFTFITVIVWNKHYGNNIKNEYLKCQDIIVDLKNIIEKITNEKNLCNQTLIIERSVTDAAISDLTKERDAYKTKSETCHSRRDVLEQRVQELIEQVQIYREQNAILAQQLEQNKILMEN